MSCQLDQWDHYLMIWTVGSWKQEHHGSIVIISITYTQDWCAFNNDRRNNDVVSSNGGLGLCCTPTPVQKNTILAYPGNLGKLLQPDVVNEKKGSLTTFWYHIEKLGNSNLKPGGVCVFVGCGLRFRDFHSMAVVFEDFEKPETCNIIHWLILVHGEEQKS